MFSGLMKFVDSLLASTPPADFRRHRRPDDEEPDSRKDDRQNLSKRPHTNSQTEPTPSQSTSRPHHNHKRQRHGPRQLHGGSHSSAAKIEEAVTLAMKNAGLDDDL